MKLSIYILLAVLGLSSQAIASTNVGATLSTDTQWDRGGSPYIIQAHVLVPPGVTLKIGPGVQVVYQGPATLEIGGELKVEGSAAAPAVFNMTDGGLQSALFIDGGEAFIANAKIQGGVFLAQDATIRMDGADVTKGSGLYLKGTTVAHLKNNKFYGNATGVVLDGPVEADMQFDTMVQNTYGVYVKDFAKLVFINNSVHDNEFEVVNNSTKIKMGGNYWGTMSPATVKNKLKGTVNLSPMKDLKDILRAYLRTELPVITKSMSDQAEAEDKRADEAARAALKAYRAKYSQNDVLAIQAHNLTLTPPATATPVPPVATATPVPPVATPTLAMSGELAAPPALSTPTVVPTATSTVSAPAVAAPPVLPAAPAPETAPPMSSSIPAPPALPSSAPEPPALSQIVAPAETVVSTPVTLPSSAAPAVTATPTFVLGGGGMTTDDLASIVATAQAASTTSASAPAAPAAVPPAAPANTAPEAPAIPPPPMSSVSTNPNIPQEVLASPPMPPDLTSTGSPDASAQAAASAAIVTSVPTAAATATFTMVWTNTPVPPAATDTPVFTATYTPTTAWTWTSTDTPVPAVPTATFTPVPPPPVTSAPAAPPVPEIAAPSAPAAQVAAPGAPGLPTAGAPTLAGSSAAAPAAPAAAASAPAAASAAPAPAASSASAPPMVPPPPDFGDNSMTYGVQAPSVPVNNNAPAAPAASSFPTTSGNKDLDVDGMQAPPMDSGLDFAAPKK